MQQLEPLPWTGLCSIGEAQIGGAAAMLCHLRGCKCWQAWERVGACWACGRRVRSSRRRQEVPGGSSAFTHRPAAPRSGGMKRRLSVAISLVGDPLVVYLDEPSTGAGWSGVLACVCWPAGSEEAAPRLASHERSGCCCPPRSPPARPGPGVAPAAVGRDPTGAAGAGSGADHAQHGGGRGAVRQVRVCGAAAPAAGQCRRSGRGGTRVFHRQQRFTSSSLVLLYIACSAQCTCNVASAAAAAHAKP